MATFHLEIVSPEGVSFDDQVSEVILPTTTGEIAILPNHAPLFTKLSEGEATIIVNNKQTHIAIFGGFVEVGRTKVTVLSDFAVRADSIEIGKVEAAKKRAEEILDGKLANEDFAMAEKELQKALFSLKIADKMKRRTH
ncbi:MAG TPA: ATP synthase F1 subunit epsilon [Candidatus Levybacteria bacterium]|nr:ATP synthase F1 subunit epsilon [Candidatus Levybacteria bacterium]